MEVKEKMDQITYQEAREIVEVVSILASSDTGEPVVVAVVNAQGVLSSFGAMDGVRVREGGKRPDIECVEKAREIVSRWPFNDVVSSGGIGGERFLFRIDTMIGAIVVVGRAPHDADILISKALNAVML